MSEGRNGQKECGDFGETFGFKRCFASQKFYFYNIDNQNVFTAAIMMHIKRTTLRLDRSPLNAQLIIHNHNLCGNSQGDG